MKNNTIVVQIHLDKRVLVILSFIGLMLASAGVWAEFNSALEFDNFKDGDIISAGEINSNFNRLITNDNQLSDDLQGLAQRLEELEGVANTYAPGEITVASGDEEADYDDLTVALAELKMMRVRPGTLTRVRLLPGNHAVPQPIEWGHPDGRSIELVGERGAPANVTIECPEGCFHIHGEVGFGGIDGVTLLGEDGVGIWVDDGGWTRLGPHPAVVSTLAQSTAPRVVVSGFAVGIAADSGAHITAGPPDLFLDGNTELADLRRRVEVRESLYRCLSATAGSSISARGLQAIDCVTTDTPLPGYSAIYATGTSSINIDASQRGVAPNTLELDEIPTHVNSRYVGLQAAQLGHIQAAEVRISASGESATIAAYTSSNAGMGVARALVESGYSNPIAAHLGSHMSAFGIQVDINEPATCFSSWQHSTFYLQDSLCQDENDAIPESPYNVYEEGKFIGSCCD